MAASNLPDPVRCVPVCSLSLCPRLGCYLYLGIERQYGVVAIGHVGDDIGLYQMEV